MADTPTDVLVAGYQDIDTATADFEALVGLVKAKQIEIEGVILVTHAEDGSVSVQQTGDNLGRKGMGWGGGVGLLVGLAAPPLLASRGKKLIRTKSRAIGAKTPVRTARAALKRVMFISSCLCFAGHPGGQAPLVPYSASAFMHDPYTGFGPRIHSLAAV